MSNKVMIATSIFFLGIVMSYYQYNSTYDSDYMTKNMSNFNTFSTYAD